MTYPPRPRSGFVNNPNALFNQTSKQPSEPKLHPTVDRNPRLDRRHNLQLEHKTPRSIMRTHSARFFSKSSSPGKVIPNPLKRTADNRRSSRYVHHERSTPVPIRTRADRRTRTPPWRRDNRSHEQAITVRESRPRSVANPAANRLASPAPSPTHVRSAWLRVPKSPSNAGRNRDARDRSTRNNGDD